MEAILAGLGLVLIIVIVLPLIVLRAGIRRQDRGSLTRRPPGLSAAIARRVLGLHASLPGAEPADQDSQPEDESLFVPMRKGPEAS
jgi:hypothetical protein